MNRSDIWLPLLVAASAAIYAIFAGRAQALRLRSLRDDVSNGKPRGFLIIAVVIALIFASFVF